MTKVFQLPTCPSNPDTLPIGPQYPWLAPLAGYSDLPFRLLCREYGAAVCVTEMVSAKGLVYESPGTNELLMTLPEDQPLVVQLFGAEAYFLGRAVELLRQAGYGWFDLNMGCSVSKVLRQGAGAAMLGDVENILVVARAMIEAAGRGRVGFKLRLGLDDARPVLPDLALRLDLVERRRARAIGPRDWHRLTAHTGLLPFAALFIGRWRPRSLPSVWRTALWLLVWAGLWLLHAPVIGVTPAP